VQRVNKRNVPHTRTSGVFGAALVAVMTLVAAPPVLTESSDSEQIEEFTDMVDAMVFGDQAVEALRDTGTVAIAADNAGMTSDDLLGELANNDGMFVTEDFAVGYFETLQNVGHHREHGIEDVGALAAAPSGDVFALQSRPGSRNRLYIDFTGHTTAHPWLTRINGGDAIVSAAYDTDGAPGSFSASERSVIGTVWQQVADDFAPFDVNVTTVDVGNAAGGVDHGTRVVVTASDWYFARHGVKTGGLALVGTFGNPSNLPSYIFAENFRDTPSIAGAVSHEAGHSFGLLHHGSGSEEYYFGHGNWAPIMGGAGAGVLSQWSKGEYANASRNQDDMAMIADWVGFIGDDYPDSPRAASVLTTPWSGSGLLSSADDIDIFNIHVAPGVLSVKLTPPIALSNTYAAVSLLDAAGNVVGRSAPNRHSSWMAVLNTPTAGGWFSVVVEPVGFATPSTGWSSYGSIGNYSLNINAASTPPSTPPPSGDRPQPFPETGTSGVKFTAVTPTRLADTRSGSRLAANKFDRVQVTGRGGVDVGATAASLNITAVNPSGAGFVTVWPCNGAPPEVSTVNYVPGDTVANNTIATLDANGGVCLYSHAESDILVDVTGWLGSGGQKRLTPVGPVRVADTRSGFGGGRLAAGQTREIHLGASVPSDASTAVALNVTAVNPAAAGFVTVFPCGVGRPDTSNLNFAAGQTRPNNVIVGAYLQRVCVYASAAVDIVVDLTATFTDSGMVYEPMQPVRVLDTRSGARIGAGDTVRYSTPGRLATAAWVNVTVVSHPADGFTTTFDCLNRAETSTLNQVVGAASANGALVPLAGQRDSCVYTQTGGDIIVDVSGLWVQ